MGWVLDRLKEVPPTAVLKERIGLIHEKYDNPISELESAVSRGLVTIPSLPIGRAGIGKADRQELPRGTRLLGNNA
jgi:hypothetical protein